MLGAMLLGVDVPPGLLKEFREALTDASWGEFRSLVKTLSPLLWSYALGSIVGAVGIAAVAYRASLTMIVAHRRHASLERHTKDTDPK
jgi:hypothetical protein